MRSDKKVAIALIAILTLSAFILVIPVSADGADFGVSPSRHRRNLVRSPSTFQAFDRSLPQSQDSRMKDSSEDGALVQGSIVPGPNQPGHPVGNGDESEYRYDWGAYPMPDVTCDNKTDVLVTFYQWSEDGNYTYRVIAKNGTTGRHLWEESVISSMSKPADIEAHGVLDWDWYWYDDLSGYYDYWYGVDDPYFWDWDWYWDWYLNWDGGDYGDWYKYSKYAPGMADMNGDGKGDVLVWLYEYNYSTDEETETLIAKNGTTGEHLWEENVTGFGWDYVDLWGYGVPDLNGDGTADVLVWLNGYNDSTDEETETLIAKNGTNGKHLWEENVTTIDTEWDYVDLWGYGVPDLNGDGTADVLVCLGGYSTYEETETLIAKNGT
ncbi:MAG: hypothetical protein JW878_06375, partial [Methanomicrobia archaeon]|nr:hypothetical protein [Methanomicrobia archaeon]